MGQQCREKHPQHTELKPLKGFNTPKSQPNLSTKPGLEHHSHKRLLGTTSPEQGTPLETSLPVPAPAGRYVLESFLRPAAGSSAA